VVILQHPRERDVPINTARIASLCLPESSVHVGLDFSRLDALADPDRPAALLYPGDDAIDVELHPPQGPITLVVVDGTWWQARKLVRSNPVLAALPRYAFRPDTPSDYRIRKQPSDECVSTIEALVRVLGVLEGDPDRFRGMLAPFHAMVEAQLAFIARGEGHRHVRHKRAANKPRRTPVPELLRERFADLVCVHGEANAWKYGTPERATNPEELVQWVACRPATGDIFESFVAPRGSLCPTTPFHTKVDASVLLAGASRESLRDRWSSFLRPTDLVCSWGTYASTLFLGAGADLGAARIDIRRAARVFASASVGTMDAFLARLALPPAPAPIATGRAGERLAQLVAITRALSTHLV
jgi:DTW domain-containing protein YfiP